MCGLSGESKGAPLEVVHHNLWAPDVSRDSEGGGGVCGPTEPVRVGQSWEREGGGGLGMARRDGHIDPPSASCRLHRPGEITIIIVIIIIIIIIDKYMISDINNKHVQNQNHLILEASSRFAHNRKVERRQGSG